MDKITSSPVNSLITKDWQRWRANMLRFLLPVVSIYLGYVSNNLGDGFAWTDFVPNAFIMGTMSLYLINSLQDLITKYLEKGSYLNGEKV